MTRAWITVMVSLSVWTSSAVGAPRFQVSKVKAQYKDHQLHVKYTLTTSKGVAPADPKEKLGVDVSCAHCGYWLKGGSSGTPMPQLAPGKPAQLSTSIWRWYRGAPPRARLCQVSWKVSRSKRPGTPVARICLRDGKLKPGACPGTVAYDKEGCARFRRAHAKQLRRGFLVRPKPQMMKGHYKELSGSENPGAGMYRASGGVTVPKKKPRPWARLGSYKVLSGKIDLASARRAIRRTTGRLRARYERALNRAPGLSLPRSTVTLTVLRTGKIGAVKVTPAVSDKGLLAVITTPLERLRMPRPGGGQAQVSFYLTLSQQSAGK